MIVTLTPKVLSVFSSLAAVCFNTLAESAFLLPIPGLRRLVGGNLYFFGGLAALAVAVCAVLLPRLVSDPVPSKAGLAISFRLPDAAEGAAPLE